MYAACASENVLLEDLPFDRAYHTPSFDAVLGPVAEFFGQLTMRPARLPVYSCASRGRMPVEVEAMRELAISQWTRTVAFRETIEAMYADGLRVFVDVGARGNLAGLSRTSFAASRPSRWQRTSHAVAV